MGFKDFQRSIPRDSEVFLEFSRGLRSVSRGLMGALWSSRVSGPSKGCPRIPEVVKEFHRYSKGFPGIPGRFRSVVWEFRRAFRGVEEV